MSSVQELYEGRIRPMVPAERLRLARLILDDLAPAEAAVDVRDEWTDDDLSDLTAHSTRHAAASGAGDEPR